MSAELVFLFSAQADIQGAYEFYEQSEPGRGEVFLASLEAAFGRLVEFPQIGAVFVGAHRRLLVGGFAYGIFYSLEGGRIIVVAVLDLRQNPRRIRRRLGGGPA